MVLGEGDTERLERWKCRNDCGGLISRTVDRGLVISGGAESRGGCYGQIRWHVTKKAKITNLIVHRGLRGTLLRDVLVDDNIVVHTINVVQAAAESGHAHVGISEVWIALSTNWIDVGKVEGVGASRRLELRKPTGEAAGTAVQCARDVRWGKQVEVEERRYA